MKEGCRFQIEQHLLTEENWCKMCSRTLSDQDRLCFEHPEIWDALFADSDKDRYETIAQNIEICKGNICFFVYFNI